MASTSTKFYKQTPILMLVLGWAFLFLLLYLVFPSFFNSRQDIVFIVIAVAVLVSQTFFSHIFNTYYIHEDKISFGKSSLQPEIPFDSIEKIEIVKQGVWTYFMGLPRNHLKVYYKLERVTQSYPVYNTSNELLNLLPKEKLIPVNMAA